MARKTREPHRPRDSFLKLTGSQMRAAEIFATNDIYDMTISEVAKEVGVSQRTIYRWKQDPDFIAYQNAIAEKVMDDFLAETYNVLKKLTRSGRSDHAKLKAVEIVLKNRGKLTDVQKVEAVVEDKRSNEAIEAEIEQLRKELGLDTDDDFGLEGTE